MQRIDKALASDSGAALLREVEALRAEVKALEASRERFVRLWWARGMPGEADLEQAREALSELPPGFLDALRSKP